MQIPAAQWQDPDADQPARAVLAGGCFWCTEAVYRHVQGVTGVRSGYAGGRAEDADYRRVCSGDTDHAEVVEVIYDPARCHYTDLLQVFFGIAHDPTQKDRQGNDVGRQYRSAVFTLNDAQADTVRAYLGQLEAARVFAAPLVTEVVTLEAFYPAESYHQDYARQHPEQPYICAVAQPKVAKLQREFPQWLRPQPLTGESS